MLVVLSPSIIPSFQLIMPSYLCVTLDLFSLSSRLTGGISGTSSSGPFWLKPVLSVEIYRKY